MAEASASASYPIPAGGPISGARIQKLLPYPSWLVFPDSAPSLLRLTGKGLMPLSSLSFSRSAFSAEPRRLSPSGRSVLRPPGSRRQRALREPYEHCTRLSPKGCGHASRRGIWRLSSAPALNPTTPPICTAEPFPFARIRGAMPRRHEIESGDYARLVTGDYFQKPLSNVAGHSRGTTLYGT